MATIREAYKIPLRQRDSPSAIRLAQLMADHGVEVVRDGNGDFWIPLAQPFSRFVREMLEPQRYPEVRVVPGADPLAPYDVATWTLPLMMGVEVEKTSMPAYIEGAVRVAHSLNQPSQAAPSVRAAGGEYYAIERTSPEVWKVVHAALRSKGSVWAGTEAAGDLTQAPVPVEFPAGTFYVDAEGARAAAEKSSETGVALIPLLRLPEKIEKLQMARVALYKPWLASMDEGWTRWLLEQYGFDVKSLDNKSIRAGGLNAKYDAIILPDVEKDVILTGKPKRAEGQMRYWEDLPAEYQGGLEKEGVASLRAFVEAGGTLIAMNNSAQLVLDELNVPIRNALAGVKSSEFNSPGSLVRLEVTQDHPVTRGLPREVAAFLDDAIVFETIPAGPEMQRWVLARYPSDARDILLSGWIKGEERLEGRAAVVAMTFGKGKIILFGFRPQHRAQTHATFPMLFNAIVWK